MKSGEERYVRRVEDIALIVSRYLAGFGCRPGLWMRVRQRWSRLRAALATIQEAVDRVPHVIEHKVAVLKGDFKAFDSWRHEISIEAALASAALPQSFQAVQIGDEVYWDGLFSQNPPVREFVAGVEPAQKPDQIWVIRINPQERKYEPTSVAAIEDRRNELSGDLLLNQELRSIRTFNELITKGLLHDPAKRPIAIHECTMADAVSAGLDPASKLDRSRAHIEGLLAHGRERAEVMLAQILALEGMGQVAGG